MAEFTNSILGFTNDALDATYIESAGSMLEQIFAISNNPNSAMQSALAKLDEEVERLNEAEQSMDPDNAVLEQTLRVYEDVTLTTQTLILANDDAIEKVAGRLRLVRLLQSCFSPLQPASHYKG